MSMNHSLTRRIQISQLHFSESFPHPSCSSKPMVQGSTSAFPCICISRPALRSVKATRGHGLFSLITYWTGKVSSGPGTEHRLKSGDSSSHRALFSPVLLGSQHKGSSYRVISKLSRPCQKKKGGGREHPQWVRSHLPCPFCKPFPLPRAS